jgi:hypothetical protein
MSELMRPVILFASLLIVQMRAFADRAEALKWAGADAGTSAH